MNEENSDLEVKDMKLECVTTECTWETQDLAEELAKWSLTQHMQHVHPAPATEQQVVGVGTRKPESIYSFITQNSCTMAEA